MLYVSLIRGVAVRFGTNARWKNRLFHCIQPSFARAQNIATACFHVLVLLAGSYIYY